MHFAQMKMQTKCLNRKCISYDSRDALPELSEWKYVVIGQWNLKESLLHLQTRKTRTITHISHMSTKTIATKQWTSVRKQLNKVYYPVSDGSFSNFKLQKWRSRDKKMFSSLQISHATINLSSLKRPEYVVAVFRCRTLRLIRCKKSTFKNKGEKNHRN